MGACTSRNFVETRYNSNTFALRARLGLHYPERITVAQHGLLELIILSWAVEGYRHKIEVFLSVKGPHSAISLEETVLASELIASWEVVDLLEAAQVVVDIRFYDRG